MGSSGADLLHLSLKKSASQLERGEGVFSKLCKGRFFSGGWETVKAEEHGGSSCKEGRERESPRGRE